MILYVGIGIEKNSNYFTGFRLILLNTGLGWIN